MTAESSFTEVFTCALRGAPTTVHPPGGPALPLPMATWSGPADAADHALLDLCTGSTLDVGCGPGRLTHELTRRGHRALGVDVVAEAVRLTRGRGADAVVADVFGPVPDEGRWSSVLLADGNIGIAGDPGRLLRRVRQLLRPGGRAIVEVTAPGTGSSSGWTSIEGPFGRSRPFRWARVAADDAIVVAATAGLVVLSVHRLVVHGERWAVVLGEP
jgi:SAM-dependent methyltransferase